MRFTARTRSIEWRADEATQAAVRLLKEILESDSPYLFRVQLAGGHGLVCVITSYSIHYTKLYESFLYV